MLFLMFVYNVALMFLYLYEHVKDEFLSLVTDSKVYLSNLFEHGIV